MKIAVYVVICFPRNEKEIHFQINLMYLNVKKVTILFVTFYTYFFVIEETAAILLLFLMIQ